MSTVTLEGKTPPTTFVSTFQLAADLAAADVAAAGTHTVAVQGKDGTGRTGSAALAVVATLPTSTAPTPTVDLYPSTGGWFAQGKSVRVRVTATMCSGTNTIELAKGSAGSVELKVGDFDGNGGAPRSRCP